ncbi:hypothetical protein DH2020_008189 [Rehmannia glutinosa]|uniref:L-asparaginase n=1 Tax=Rehmannia glutinosa TaxID=99300 RepID=A0ABR0U143_REHGL
MSVRKKPSNSLLVALTLAYPLFDPPLSAIDVVELVVRELESDPLFNSGRGSALTEKGTVEMEASIMDGPGRRCGAVSGVTTVRNPISLARLVMDKSPIPTLLFLAPKNSPNNTIPTSGLESCAAVVEKPIQMNGLPISVYAPETVGCVVVDSQGRCAAATSTGGLMNKMVGRIGDSPLIGARHVRLRPVWGFVHGRGEAIIRGTLARDVAALMEYKELSLQEAVDYVIKRRLDDGKAGLIAVSSKGSGLWV